MKEKIGYFLLIVIAILGSRLLYGINYDLNSETEVQPNLYHYDIIENSEFLDMKLDGNYLYYVVSDVLEDKHKNNIEYVFNKYDLAKNKLINSYHFISKNMLYPVKIIKKGNYWLLTSLYSNVYYKFNKDLELIKEDMEKESSGYTYGIYNNNHFSVLENKIFYKGGVYDVLPETCGYNQEIIYSDNTYIRFYNYSKNIGCLYNMNTKKIYYLDYENIDISSTKYLEYQDNSLKFRYNNELYYFNDITENENLKMHKNGDYLLTYDSSNNYLHIYNLDTKRIIYEKKVEEFNDSIISNVSIDNYAYFTVKNKNNISIYIWDYLHDNKINKSMILQDEKEYKFENNQLLNEIKSKYNIDIYLYDKAVKNFDNIYVIPIYDEVLINTKLNTLKRALEEINYINNKNITVFFEKEIYTNSNDEMINIYKTNIDNKTTIVISLFDNNFDKDLLKALN